MAPAGKRNGPEIAAGKTVCLWALFLFLLIPFRENPAGAAEKVTILLTSNTEGRFSPKIEGQEKEDPMILLGQSVLMESRKGVKHILDLGNAFYPGVLSKHSYGAAVMDFFTYFNFRASLVSSKDLRLGASSLEFLQKSGTTRLLSANIQRDGRNLFTPYIIETINGRKVAFVGLTSKKVLFDIAEMNVYQVDIADEEKVVRSLVSELKQKGIEDIILLSGLDFRDTVKLMKKFPGISLAISGGDNRGDLEGGTAIRVDLLDRRSAVFVPPGSGYCLLTLTLGKKISIAGINFKTPRYYPANTEDYRDFIQRTTIWKRQFLKETDQVITKLKEKPLLLNQERTAHFLRDIYRAEVAIISNNAIDPSRFNREIRKQDIISAVNDNYMLYTYTLTGNDILDLKDFLKGCTVSGLENEMVQGYPVAPDRKYLLVSTQTAYEDIVAELDREIKYRIQWKNMPELIMDDLANDKVILKNDYRYLERRFRTMIDIYVSAFYERSDISVNKDMNIPVGEPEESYDKWGLEAQVDFTFYNRYHKLIFTPYINYSRQGKLFLSNLLRGTFYYNLNVHSIATPYHKTQFETVVTEVRGGTPPDSLSSLNDLIKYYESIRKLRPVIGRETIGVQLQSSYVTGRIGGGFEKQVYDPVKPIVYGFEAILKVEYPFLKYLTYTLNIDSFIAVPEEIRDKRREERLKELSNDMALYLNYREKVKKDAYIRSMIENKLTFSLNRILFISVKHRWYYYYFLDYKKKYSNSQFIASVDIKADFKAR
jgi:hypothetical protein